MPNETRRGLPGVPGEPGEQGPRGQLSPAFAKRMLALFLVTVALFGYLAWRNESNANATKRVAEIAKGYAVSNCELSNANTKRFNLLIDAAIAGSKANERGLPASEVAKNVALLEGSKGSLANCNPPPSKR